MAVVETNICIFLIVSYFYIAKLIDQIDNYTRIGDIHLVHAFMYVYCVLC